MTMDEIDRRARDIAASHGFDEAFLVGGIRAALVEMWDGGIEAAAVDLESKFKVHWHGRKVALYGVAEAVRSKKLGGRA